MRTLLRITNRNIKIFSKPAILALVLFGLLVGGMAVKFSPLFSKPTPPDLAECNRLMKIFEGEPENQKSWDKMLDCLKKEERFLARWKQNDKVNKTAVELQIINTHQRKGIALRHLKRYSEALQELTKAQSKLSRLQQKYKCEPGANGSICKDINTMFSMTYTYFSNVYQNLQDKANAEKYLKLAIQFSRASKKYYTYLVYLITFYAENDDFKLALNLILTSLEKAIASSNNQEEIKKLSELASHLYRQLFKSINWNLITGKIRENDPRDFADTHGIGIGRQFKYGMTNKEEDFATFGTVIIMHNILQSEASKGFDLEKMAKDDGYSSVKELKKNSDIKGYVIEQLSQENFEPAVKYLSQEISNKFYLLGEQQLKCSRENTSDINIDLVKEKLEEAPIGEALTSTVNTIEVIESGNIFLNKYCKN